MMDTIDARPVEAERQDDLHKAEFERGFYNIIDSKKVAASKRPSVINPVTKKQLVAIPDVDRALPVNCKAGRDGLARTLFEILSFRPVRMRTRILVWSLARKASYAFPRRATHFEN